MAKQLNLDLNIRANTAQAKSEFQSLQKSLSDIAAQSAQVGHVSVDSTQLKQASAAAQELQRHLSNAVNVDTGKLNLNKLNTSLKQSKTDIGELSGKLLSVGPAGQQAFVQLAQSVANAERPVISLGSRLGGLLTTLKNTARWQISSTILHGFMGALQSAYGYAQDLNKSLNNIRVVTGHSAEQMEKFAIEANNAAKALSTSTTAYTDAALIYYQQGLPDDKVKERTATTIKLANVSRQSAEEVSSQMTAIWNNFAKGSSNLEYYADVITALGANTASSSQEIAEGLSKFAAVADTVGLSYEKASAALATVVAETRQSADIVGTAFKTMFARIEGLKQGETMEDGVGLNKYSEALAKVGVSVLDSTNQLRKMDDILDELGEKWNNIDKTQQVALAQTVAGVRQYTQFVSLMNNYEKVQANEEIAKDSEGTVQKQADIYAESWEASSKRVKASLQGIYDDLLDDKFFIQMNNFFADLLNGLDNFIKGIGGLKGVLLGLGSLFLNYVADKIMPVMQNLKIQLQTMFQSPTKQAETYGKMMKSIFDQAKSQLGVGPESQMTDSLKAQLSYTEKLSIAKNKLTAVDKQLTDTERQQAQAQLNIINIHQQEVQAIADKITKEKEELDVLIDSMNNKESVKDVKSSRQFGLDALTGEMQEWKALRDSYTFDEEGFALNPFGERDEEGYFQAVDGYNAASEALEEYKDKTETLISTKENLANVLKEEYENFVKMQMGFSDQKEVAVNLGSQLTETAKDFDTLGDSISKNSSLSNKDIQQINEQFEELQSLELDSFEAVSTGMQEVKKAIKSKDVDDVVKALKNLGLIVDGLEVKFENTADGAERFNKTMDKMGQGKNAEDIHSAYTRINKTQQQLTKEQQRLNEAFNNFNPQHIMTGVEAFSKVAAAGMQAAMIINSIKGLIEAWTNEDMDPMEKFTTTLMSIGMIVPGVISSFQGMSSVITTVRSSLQLLSIQTKADNVQTAIKIGLKEKEMIVDGKIAAEEMVKMAVKKGVLDQEKVELAQEALIQALKKKGSALNAKEIATIIAKANATNLDTLAKSGQTVATEAATTAQWGLNAAMMANPIGIVIAAVVALIAVITLLTVVIYNMINAETKEEQALKKANKELEKAKTAAEEAKKAYEDLKNKISDYKGAVDALKKYTKGTQEWRDAFQEVLNKANELIEKYPTLLSYSNLFNSDGSLNQDALNQALTDYERYSKATNLIAFEAQENVDRKKIEKAESENLKTVSDKFFSTDVVVTNKNTGESIITDDDLQSLINQMAKSPNSMKFANLIQQQNKYNQLEDGKINPELKSFVEQYFNTTGKINDISSTQELDYAVNQVVQSLGSLGDEFNTFSEETKNLSTSLANNRKLMIANFFGDSVDVGNAANLAAAEVVYEDYYSKYQKEFEKDMAKKVSSSAIGNAQRFAGEGWFLPLMIADAASNNFQLNIDDKEMQGFAKQYKEANPMAKNWNYKTTRLDNSGNVSFIFTDPDNNDEEQVISGEDITKVLTDNKMLEKGTSDKINEEVLAKTREFEKRNAFALDYAANGNIQNATLNDIKNFTNSEDINDELLQNLMISSGRYTEEQFKNEEDRKKLIAEERKRIEEAKKAAEASAEALPDYINDFLPGDIKYTEAEKVGQLYKKALINNGEGILNDIKTAAGNEAAEVLTALSNLDLDNSNVEEANQALAAMGIQFKLSAEQFYSLKNTVKDIGSISIETAQETYKQISAILAKIKSQGDILEDEDYNKLLAINPTLESFFTTLADGTHMFTGEIQDFKKAVQSSQMNQMREAIDNQERIAGSYNTIANGSSDNQQVIEAKIDILFNNPKTKNEAIDYMADLKTGEETLSNISSKVEESYKSLGLTEEQFATQTEQAAKKVIELREAMKESLYQNEIANAGLEYETTENYANTLMDLYEAEGLTKDAARELAIANQRLDRGLSSLNDSFEDWTKSLQNTNKASAEYAKTIKEIRDSFADLLNIADGNELSLDWIEKWINDSAEMEKILNGDTEAIQRFRESAFAEMTTNVFSDMQDAVKQLKKEMENSNTKIPDWLTDINNKLLDGKFNAENFRNAIHDIDGQAIGAGASLSEEYTEALNKMLAQGLITEQQLNDIFATIGYKPKVTTATVDQEAFVPEYTTTEYIAKEENVTTEINGEKKNTTLLTKKTQTKQTGGTYMTQKVPVTQIETEENGSGKIDIVNAGSVNMSPSYSSTSSGKSSDSGSDSSSSKNTSAASHEHEVNRYSDEENAINGLADQYERLGKIKDKAFGAGVLQAMEKELSKLKELKQASSNYLEAIVGAGNAEKVAQTLYSGGNIGSLISSGQLGGTIAADYNSLFSGTSASGKNVEYTAKDSAGNEYLASTNYNLNDFKSMFGSSIDFQLDSYGNITNKDSILNELQRLKNNENDNYSNYADPDAGTTSEHNKRIAYLDEIKERIEQYGTTIEDLSTQTDAYLDYISQIQEKNAEIITTKLNNGITLSNNTLTRLERALKILGDDIYKSTEKMAQYFDTKMNSSRTEYQNQAQLNANAMAEVQEKVKLYQENPLDENAISPAQAAEIMQTVEENYANLYEKAVQDITDMEELYGNTIDKQKEKISELTTQIDFNIQKLDHLQKVFELLGKKTDYKQLGKILNVQAQGAETNYNVQKAKAEEARKLYSEHQAKAAKMSGTELEEYEKTVLAKDRALLQEYEKEEQTAFQTWIEKLQAIHDNNINQIYQDFEDNLTGEYGSFSNLDAAMERQKSITEEYLTKTNQLYETNKMLRNLQKDIDKTDNRIAKEKLKAFSDEITAMQNKEKLTKTDLDLAKAKYEVLKAQIALEEAQNAKSTVRLQRDNEGNYGYIYTADQDKISDAEQNLADKENALYNLALSQANDFSQKLEKIGQEYMEARKKLEQERDEGLISEEQYEQSLIELQDYYRDLELRYLDGYNTAAGILDDEAIEGRIEAWGAGFEHILDDRRLFNDESTGAAQDLNSALQAEMQDWNSTRKSLLEEAGLDNKNFENTINDVTSEIKDLGDQITKDGGLIDQFDEMATSTEKLTRDFVAQYEALLNEANGYLEAANQANSYQNELAQLTNQQLQYNAALAAQPSTVTSGNTSGNYNNNSSEKSSSYDSSTSPKIGNNKDSSSDKTKNYQFVQYSSGGAAVEVKDTFTGKTFWVDKYTARNWGLVKFKSGGYTGSWDGPDLEENGKLAFLHQKELVLNASDTENLLEAVKFIRQISQNIDLQALSQAQGLSIQAAQFSTGGQTLQQEVTIHAEFPNVSDRNEIEEALSNLVNRATQFANRY